MDVDKRAQTYFLIIGATTRISSKMSSLRSGSGLSEFPRRFIVRDPLINALRGLVTRDYLERWLPIEWLWITGSKVFSLLRLIKRMLAMFNFWVRHMQLRWKKLGRCLACPLSVESLLSCLLENRVRCQVHRMVRLLANRCNHFYQGFIFELYYLIIIDK